MVGWWTRTRRVVQGALLAALAACSAPAVAPSTAELPKTVAPNAVVPYVIQPGDDIEVKFQATPELNERQIVRPDGKIALQLVSSDIQAAGQSVDQLRRALLEAYAHQLRDPEITVLLREYAANRIYVGGEVAQVGVQPLTRATTVFQAILQAQGFKDTAYPGQVILYRSGAGDSAGTWRALDLSKAPAQPGGDQDVLLAPLDIVFVPRSPISEVGNFVELYIRRLLPIQPTVQTTP